MVAGRGSRFGRYLPPQLEVVDTFIWVGFRDSDDIAQVRIVRADAEEPDMVIVETADKHYFAARESDETPPFWQLQVPGTQPSGTRRKFDAVLHLPAQTTWVHCRGWATDVRNSDEDRLECTVVRWDIVSDGVTLLLVHNGDILITGVDCKFLPFDG